MVEWIEFVFGAEATSDLSYSITTAFGYLQISNNYKTETADYAPRPGADELYKTCVIS